MIWSFSAAGTFRRCQRQWYFKEYVAEPLAKRDHLRREAYLLSKLQSIQAWRGSLVDQIISKRIVPSLNAGHDFDLNRALADARVQFERQLDFAIHSRFREQDSPPSGADGAYAAFYAVEYGSGVTDAEIAQAWADVELALRNLARMTELMLMLNRGRRSIPQRPLLFHHGQVSVRAVPDLIAFADDEPPLIVDWKVHFYGTRDYRVQLACYAVALTRCKPHRDFPVKLAQYKPTDVHLFEAQLLTNRVRCYDLSEADIDAVDSLISLGSTEMLLALGKDADEVDSPFYLPTAEDPGTCQRCAFRSLCWGDRCSTAKQMSFL